MSLWDSVTQSAMGGKDKMQKLSGQLDDKIYLNNAYTNLGFTHYFIRFI